MLQISIVCLCEAYLEREDEWGGEYGGGHGGRGDEAKVKTFEADHQVPHHHALLPHPARHVEHRRQRRLRAT